MKKTKTPEQRLVPIGSTHHFWKVIALSASLFSMYAGKSLLLDKDKGTVYMVGNDDQVFDVGHYDKAKKDYSPWNFNHLECLKSC